MRLAVRTARSTTSRRQASLSDRPHRAGERDNLEATGLSEGPPGSCGRAALFDLGDLLDRSALDERTGAEAISHGEVSCLYRWSPAGRAVRGGFVPAGDLILM